MLRHYMIKTASMIAIICFCFAETVVAVRGQSAPAPAIGCRQSWMPPDAPAFCAWRPENSLPEPRTYAAVTLAGDSVHVLGGYRYDALSGQVIYYDSALRSVIRPDGSLGPWSVEAPFRSARSGAAATRSGECIFLNGGSSFRNGQAHYEADTQYAHLTPDNRIIAWSTSPNHLNTPRSNHSLIAVTTDMGSYLYAVAGVTELGPDTIHLDTIEYAKLASDCSVGPWTVAKYHLRGGRSSPQALAIGKTLTVVGGWGDLDLIDVFSDVQMVPVRPDGSPGPGRTPPGPLPTGIYGHATAFVDNGTTSASLLLSVAGQPGTGAYANWIAYAYILPGIAPSDALGIWRIAPSGQLPSGRAGLGVVQLGHRIYAIGGSGPNGQYLREVLSATFDSGRP
jgi:Kelch motif